MWCEQLQAFSSSSSVGVATVGGAFVWLLGVFVNVIQDFEGLSTDVLERCVQNAPVLPVTCKRKVGSVYLEKIRENPSARVELQSITGTGKYQGDSKALEGYSQLMWLLTSLSRLDVLQKMRKAW